MQPSDEAVARAERFLNDDTERDEWATGRRLLGGFSDYRQCFIHAFALGYDQRLLEMAEGSTGEAP